MYYYKWKPLRTVLSSCTNTTPNNVNCVKHKMSNESNYKLTTGPLSLMFLNCSVCSTNTATIFPATERSSSQITQNVPQTVLTVVVRTLCHQWEDTTEIRWTVVQISVYFSWYITFTGVHSLLSCCRNIGKEGSCWSDCELSLLAKYWEP